MFNCILCHAIPPCQISYTELLDFRTMQGNNYYNKNKWMFDQSALREESSQTNVILQYNLLAAIFSAVCSVIQQL